MNEHSNHGESTDRTDRTDHAGGSDWFEEARAALGTASRRGFMRRGGALGAAALSLGTASGTAGATPQIETVTIVEATEEHPRADSARILERPDGSLLVVYHKMGDDAHDFSASHIYRKFSYDGGHTWEDEDRIVALNGEGVNLMQPAPIYMPDGTILMVVLRKLATFTTRMELHRSTDHGETFERVGTVWEATDEWYRIAPPTRSLIRLSSGRLVVPVHEALDPYTEPYHFGAYLSDDGGETWRRSTDWHAGWSERGLMEPQVVERADGTLLASLRNRTGRVMFSHSEDGGDTWADPRQSGLASPAPHASNTSLTRIPTTGRLLHLWNDPSHFDDDSGFGRTPLTAAVSRDGGATWENAQNILADPNGYYSNLGCDYVGENTALVHYMERDSVTGFISLKAAHAPISWFYHDLGNSDMIEGYQS